jgi:hypothetical protein
MPVLRVRLSLVRCRPDGQPLIALPRRLRAAQAQPEREFLPGHPLGTGDDQQRGLELVDLRANLGHQRQSGGQVGDVHVIFAVLEHGRARRQAHQQPDRLAGSDHRRRPRAGAAGGGIGVPLVDAEERGVLPFHPRLRWVRRRPCLGHACDYRARTHSCQLLVFNDLFIYFRR